MNCSEFPNSCVDVGSIPTAPFCGGTSLRRTRQQAEHLMELLKEKGADGEVYHAAEELINSVR